MTNLEKLTTMGAQHEEKQNYKHDAIRKQTPIL